MSHLKIARIDSSRDDLSAALDRIRALLSPQGNVVSEAGRRRTIDVFGKPLTPQEVVATILHDVRTRGLEAVLDYSARIDRAELTPETMRVPEEELWKAHAEAAPEFLAAVRRIRENVLRFQTAILHKDVTVPLDGGGYLAQRYLPLSRVGICVPGGAAAYPSTVLMTAVPAQAAGVRELAVVAPPTPFGSYNRELLATCCELGITEVYRLGVQAVAALAYGVEGLPRVDKIVGPGNLFVALAKQQVYGQVDIDSIAGPSEVVVVADETARPDHTAADLISQAEHSPGGSLLVTWHAPLIDQVQAELEAQLARLERGDLARESLEAFGALILVANEEEAAQVATAVAPEHLHLSVGEPEVMLKKIPTAGAAFLGHASPVALGDYAAGPSHVLPTGGTARFASGLSSNHFLRSHSVIAASQEDLRRLADDVRMLANQEGLTAHRLSVDIRLEG